MRKKTQQSKELKEYIKHLDREMNLFFDDVVSGALRVDKLKKLIQNIENKKR